MQMIRSFLIAFMMLFGAQALAATATAKGQATVKYESSLFGKKVTPEVRAQAVLQAQLKAIDKYYAEAGDAQSQNLDAIREKVKADPDRYILETAILNEEDRPDMGQYTVTLRATLNVSQLNNAVKASSAVAQAANGGQKSKLTFIFVSRQTDSSQRFDDREYQAVEVKAQGKASRSGGQYRESVETGGSTTRKATKKTYAIFPSNYLKSVFNGVFAGAGFKVVDAAYLEPYSKGLLKIKSVETDFKSGNDLQPQTERNVAAGLQNAKVPYIAYGTLDVRLADTDPATGLFRVSVAATGKLLDASDAIPETKAEVGPIQAAGLGPTEEEAQVNALKKAAEDVARELLSQMTNAGIK
ncbi:hypothetical protein DK842_09805 [Chromobacterium phragmitis]|uniref:Uncharacterized protein n=2 Tax=Chromobacterium phragmitis TaxID=2202141 RepID=A0A344UJX0_9NEIS|nr:hypothetical protein DK842_09805 [Chromobacterium phragmitis]AXE35568.1 hypothetical protein DK843_15380 [Chromobacterium phragmitis]